MKDLSTVLKAVEQILNNATSGYYIERSPIRAIDDSELPAEYKAWVGLLKDGLNYTPARIVGGASRFGVKGSILVIVQVMDLESQEKADEKLTAAEKDIIEVLADAANLKLPYNGQPTVGMIDGFSVEYEIKAEESAYYQAAIITLEFSE